jgi:hypothetical protein
VVTSRSILTATHHAPLAANQRGNLRLDTDRNSPRRAGEQRVW